MCETLVETEQIQILRDQLKYLQKSREESMTAIIKTSTIRTYELFMGRNTLQYVSIVDMLSGILSIVNNV